MANCSGPRSDTGPTSAHYSGLEGDVALTTVGPLVALLDEHTSTCDRRRLLLFSFLQAPFVSRAPGARRSRQGRAVWPPSGRGNRTRARRARRARAMAHDHFVARCCHRPQSRATALLRRAVEQDARRLDGTTRLGSEPFMTRTVDTTSFSDAPLDPKMFVVPATYQFNR